MKYTAFISYRHTEVGRAHAERLESALKRYAKPFWKPPIGLFRDERAIKPGDDLPSALREALRDSQFLLYLASKEAAESEWIRDELRIWCEELGRAKRLIIVHIADRIGVDRDAGRIQWPESDALPDVLRSYIASIPVWADLSWATTDEQRDLGNAKYRAQVNAIVATFRNKDPGDMNDVEVLVHRRNVRVQRGAVATIAVLASAATALAFKARADRDAARHSEQHASAAADTARAQRDTAQRQRDIARARKREADEQRDIAEERRRMAESRLLAAHAEELFQRGIATASAAPLLPVGLLLAEEAQRTYPTWEGDRSLRKYLSIMPRLVAVVPRDSARSASVRFMPSGDLLLVADGHALRALNAVDGGLRYRREMDGAATLSVSPGGRYAAVVFGGYDSVAVMRAETGEELFRLACREARAWFSEREDRVALTCWHAVHVRHLPDAAPILDFLQTDNYSTAALAAFSENGRYLTIGDDGARWIRRWDLTAPVHELPTPAAGSSGKALSPNGRFWVKDDALPTPHTTVLDLSSDANTPSVWLPLPTVATVSFTRDSRRLVASGEGRVEVWNLVDRKLADSLPPGVKQASDLDDTRQVRAYPSKTTVIVSQVDGKHDLTYIVPPSFQQGPASIYVPVTFNGYDLSWDGRRVATNGPDGAVRLWESQATADTARVEGLVARGLTMGPSGDVWASGSRRLAHLRLGTGEVTKTESGSYFETLSMSEDGSRLVAGGELERGVELVPGFGVLDVRTGATLRQQVTVGQVADVAFVPHSRVVAVLTSRGLLFYDVSDAAVLRPLTYEAYLPKLDSAVFLETTIRDGGIQPEIRRIAFSQDGRYLLLLGTTSVRVVEFPGGNVVVRERADLPVAAFGAGDTIAITRGVNIRLKALRGSMDSLVAVSPDFRVRDIAFTPSGKYLAIAADGGTVRIWDVGLRQEVSRIEAPYAINRIAFDSRHNWLITATSGGVQAWPWMPEELIEMAKSRRPYPLNPSVIDEFRTPALSKRLGPIKP